MPIADYLVLTPLNEEFRYLREAWPVPLHEEKVGQVHYYRGLHTFGSRHATVVAAAMLDMGQAWSGVFASEALRVWSPANVVHIGIAGTLDKDVEVGDIVIPAEVIGYEVGDAIDTPEGPDIRFRSTGAQGDFALIGSAHALQDDPQEYKAWQQQAYDLSAAELGQAGQTRRPCAHVGAKQVLASGNFVVKSADFGDKLRKTLNHKITAVEMEAKGLFNAVRLASERPATLIIRGISDRADREKSQLDASSKGAFRSSSVRAAAKYLASVIERRLRLDHADDGSQLLQLHKVLSRNGPLIARMLGLQSKGSNSLCLAIDPLMRWDAGAPRLELKFKLTTATNGTDTQFAMRQERDGWSRTFASDRVNAWNCKIERSVQPYSLAFALVSANLPEGQLSIRVRDEFGRTTGIVLNLGSGKGEQTK